MLDFETLAVVSESRGKYDGAVCPPLFLTSTFDGGGEYSYSRLKNPTRDSLQSVVAALEGAKHAFAFSSGMAAVNALLLLLKSGDRAVISRDCYGGVIRLTERIMQGLGIEFIYIDPCDTVEAARAAEGARLMLVETPSNPLLKCCDIQKLAEICHYNGATLAVDNTFMTPFLQKPLSLGADIVVHSATKFLCGHHDATGGLLVTSDDQTAEALSLISGTCGNMLSPFDCFLIRRGIETLHLRMPRHCLAAKTLADVLRSHPNVSEVLYPDADETNLKQSRSGGGVVSFRLKKDVDLQKIASNGIIRFAESLGGTVSLVTHPYSQTHASLSEAQKAQLGITKSLLRLSPGLESIDDLVTALLDMVG